eukprot:1275769-Alexandrium_andersonii.AAC.1
MVAATASGPAADSRAVRNLSCAFHRFDSVLQPLGRAVMYMEALLATAFRILTLRHGQTEADDAAQFLAFVAGQVGMERLVVMSMMVDSGNMVM